MTITIIINHCHNSLLCSQCAVYQERSLTVGPFALLYQYDVRNMMILWNWFWWILLFHFSIHQQCWHYSVLKTYWGGKLGSWIELVQDRWSYYLLSNKTFLSTLNWLSCPFCLVDLFSCFVCPTLLNLINQNYSIFLFTRICRTLAWSKPILSRAVSLPGNA